MKNRLMKLLALAVLAAGATMSTDQAQASSLLGANGLRPAVDSLSLVETVQGSFWHRGRRYCWYDIGVFGPGWYVCGYARNPNRLYWGGGRGWNNWWWGGWGPRRGGPRRGGGPVIIINPMGGGMMGGPGPMMGGGGPMMMSDIRAKQAIALVGRLDNGLGLYRFQYTGEQQVYVGVMAHEVQEVMPAAVARGSDGYLRVNYSMVGTQMQTWEQWTAR